MKVREVICKRWFLNSGIGAITLYPFIFFHGIPTEKLRKHEYIHVEQIRRLGWFKFYFLYFYYSITVGYKNNPLELETYGK